MNPTPKDPQANAPTPSPASAVPDAECRSGRMHDNVPVWSDPCCSCEAEPYWLAVADDVENDRDGESPASAP
jgi:hypothetical protein